MLGETSRPVKLHTQFGPLPAMVARAILFPIGPAIGHVVALIDDGGHVVQLEVGHTHVRERDPAHVARNILEQKRFLPGWPSVRHVAQCGRVQQPTFLQSLPQFSEQRPPQLRAARVIEAWQLDIASLLCGCIKYADRRPAADSRVVPLQKT